MMKPKEWSLTGASGTEYIFSISPKSEGLPQSPGIFIPAYCHPRGHMAGWEVTPLHIDHAEDMSLMLEGEVELAQDQKPLWNSNLVLREADSSAREKCVRDLEIYGS